MYEQRITPHIPLKAKGTSSVFSNDWKKRGKMPLSPYKKVNDNAPINGGKAIGTKTRTDKTFLPGNSYLCKRKAIVTPTIAQEITLMMEIKYY